MKFIHVLPILFWFNSLNAQVISVDIKEFPASVNYHFELNNDSLLARPKALEFSSLEIPETNHNQSITFSSMEIPALNHFRRISSELLMDGLESQK